MTGLRRYRNKRDANEPAIVEALQKVGALVFRLDKPVDLLVCFRGQVFLVEVKMPKGRRTKDQEEFHAAWPVHVLRHPDDCMDMLFGAREAA